MKTLLLITTLFVSIGTYAQQSIAYYYDNGGNRIQRAQCNCVGNKPAHPTDTTTNNTLAANILPNPTKGNLAIEVTETTFVNNQKSSTTVVEEIHFHVIVYDIYGRAILNEQYDNTTFNIDITEQPPGAYFVKLFTANKVKQWKVIKE